MKPTSVGRWSGRWRGTRRWVILTAAGVFLAVLAALVGAAVRRPSWYAPPEVDHARLKTDKRDLVQLLDAIGEALNAGRGIDFELSEAQVNRWLAAGPEFWPDLKLETAALRSPQVAFRTGNRIRVGGLAASGSLQVVVSATAAVTVEPDSLLVSLTGAKVGALPLPRAAVWRLLALPSGWSGQPQADPANDTLRWPNDWTWSNGKRRFRVRRLEVERGVVRVALEPFGAGP